MPQIPLNMDPALRDKVFVSTVGEVPPISAADLNSFLVQVHHCCARMLDSEPQLTPDSCAFVLSERLELDPVFEQYSGDFTPSGRLDNAQKPSIPGPIVLTTQNLRLVFSKTCADTTVAGVVAELRRLGLADRPTSIFVPAQRTLTFYPRGVNAKATFAADAGALRNLDPHDLLALLDHFHEKYTRYPDGLGACWDNATERVVERHAERNIRNDLFVFLSMVVYRTDYIAREHQLPNGRVDIFVYGIVFGDNNAHRVLELKVLRSKSIGWKPGKQRSYSEAVNKKYAEKGVRQAQRYKQATGAHEAFLCCFDARLDNTEIDVRVYAQSLNVVYRRYFMESSVKE